MSYPGRSLDYLFKHLDKPENNVLLLVIVVLWLVRINNKLKFKELEKRKSNSEKNSEKTTTAIVIILYILAVLFALKLIFELVF